MDCGFGLLFVPVILAVSAITWKPLARIWWFCLGRASPEARPKAARAAIAAAGDRADR
jgi:hypothetical protein